jgi:hypothetical protein
VVGEIIHPYQPKASPHRPALPSKGPHLLSNKHFLSWGGVPLGRARQQKLTLKNVADHMLKLRLEIKATHDNFQVCFYIYCLKGWSDFLFLYFLFIMY